MHISVIIPTRNRCEQLRNTLVALGQQTAAHAEYEVIVVADGCTDATTQVARETAWPYALKILEQPHSGAAAARNLGASAARGEILLFLDDDMEAQPGLIEAHLRKHQTAPGSVVLGNFPMPPAVAEEDAFSVATRQWWQRGFVERESDSYRFTFWDFCTGNVSVPRSEFERAGGFDTALGADIAGEDYDLGIRLLRLGLRFHYVREALSIHHDRPGLKRNLLRAEQEGRGQTKLVRKYPELFSYFQVGNPSRLSTIPLFRPLWKLLWRHPGWGDPLARLLINLILFAAVHGLHSPMWKLHRLLRGYYYWKGMQSALGSLSAWERLAQAAPPEPAICREIEIELTSDLARLNEILAETPADAGRITFHGAPVLRIAPVAGAEPLRSPHVTKELIKRVPGLVFAALLDSRLST